MSGMPVDLAPPGAPALVDLLGHDAPARRRIEALAAVTPDEWQLLAGHGVVDGRELTGASVRAQYVHLTDRLIHRITHEGFDRAIFLDKSARPVCWLMRFAWPVLAPSFDEGSPATPPPMPRCTMLNIDRLQWRELMDPNDVGRFDVDEIPDEVVNGLRTAFAVRPGSGGTWLDGERVLVVDEVRVSGDTGAIACGILSRAFPDTSFVSHQWMTPKLVTRDRNRYNNQLPVWYRDDTHLGRGIGDRDPAWSRAHRNPRIRAGAWFLSRPLPERDPQSEQLRFELRALAGSVLRGETPLIPAADRDDYEHRCQTFNGVDPITLRQHRESNDLRLDL